MAEPRATAAVRVTWKGKVQGVWFRGFVIDNATELGLKGWVRNRPTAPSKPRSSATASRSTNS